MFVHLLLINMEIKVQVKMQVGRDGDGDKNCAHRPLQGAETCGIKQRAPNEAFPAWLGVSRRCWDIALTEV